MTPEQTLDWLAEQHKSQCNEDRPVQEWIRSMKSMLPAPTAQEPALVIYHGEIAKSNLPKGFTGMLYTAPPAQPAPVQEPVYVQLRHIDEDGDASPWGQPLDPKERHTKWAKGVEMRLLYTTPPAQPAPVPLTDDRIYAIGKELGMKCRLGGNPNIDLDYARAIEAAHGITEKGKP
jgi:hypothetical protein